MSNTDLTDNLTDNLRDTGGHEVERENLGRLFTGLWRLGSNALVAWFPNESGIEILTVPKIRLFSSSAAHPRVFDGARLMDKETFDKVGRALNVQPIEIRLDQKIGIEPDQTPPGIVERVFRNYTTTKTQNRMVYLVDIVGFSRFSAEAQASQLATLEFALNIAETMATERGIEANLMRSTTGDGFYVWNRSSGLEADMNCLVVIVLFLTYHAALQRTVGDPTAVPEIRSCLSVGSHYTYYQPSMSTTAAWEYIVGEVTISVARLIAGCKPGQIMLGDFTRSSEDGGPDLDSAKFIAEVVERIQALKGLNLPGGAIERAVAYLTGPQAQDGGYRNQRMSVTDKHGLKHYCYNLKINVFSDDADPFLIGVQHSELFKPK